MTTLRDISLEHRYTAREGDVLLTGPQALVRLLLAQAERDRAQGLRTAGYVTGYRGSPLGGVDVQLERERSRLEAAAIRFQPGLNEDLAATAVWGTQQVPLLPGARYDGVFSLWYAKGPGVDRSGDAIKHGNRMGTTPHGGVLLAFGDDHAGKSSTVAHQSEQALAAAAVPVLYPATVQELLDFGLYGYALSRASGLWVGLKCVNETAEATATVAVAPGRPQIVLPAPLPASPDGLHARLHFDPLGDDVRLMRWKLPAAQAFVRANEIDRVLFRPASARLGIVAAGKTFLDVQDALALLGLDATRAAALGLALYKPGVIWPLEPQRLRAFGAGLDELFVIEEKAAFIEPQAAHALYDLPADRRPRLAGKRAPQGHDLLPSDVQLDGATIARVLGERLRSMGLADAALLERLARLLPCLEQADARPAAATVRKPYFCSGCPHNTSTRVPEGSIALAGIGCHTMALSMERHTLPPTQMGGEGLLWAGIAPFSDTPHVFQNLGDGTYAHSGLLAVRAAVLAGVNITYKLLVNDAVAMTGGQPVEGGYSVAEIARQLAAERVARIVVVTDDPSRHRGVALPDGVAVQHRDLLDSVQRSLRETRGVTVLIYDQTCAAEKRRRRKRGRFPDPDRRVFINPLVCEGCGDCSTQSNCVSVEPLETEFGRKRTIDQSSCNKDYSCLKGFCPSFVTVSGAKLRTAGSADGLDAALAGLPPPPAVDLAGSYAMLIPGIGGTGITTLAAILAMAAHLDGRAASVFDMTGMAQKGGAVLSHLRIARDPAQLGAPKIGALGADLVLGCDLLVAAGPDVLRCVDAGRTRAAVNARLTPTADFQLRPDIDFGADALAARVREAVGAARCDLLDATEAAKRLLGDTVAANMLLLGYALQRGLLPLGLESIERAVELNGVAVALNRRALALGRLAAAAPDRFAALLGDGAAATAAPTAASPAAHGGEELERIVAVRERFLVDYQDAAYAARYRALVERVAAAERALTPDSRVLATAVARGYFKLLAYKDEYEVARLHTDPAFRAQLEAQFAGDFRVELHLAPPFLSRPDPATGRPRKRTFGPWLLPWLRLLARCRRLRGTPFDPFGATAERRLERALIREYEADVGALLDRLTTETLATAVELAQLPQQIRGYGFVKERHAREAATRRLALRERLGAGIGAT